MKVPLHSLFVTATLPLAMAWTAGSSSRSSSFTGSNTPVISKSQPRFSGSALVMYEPSNEPPNRDSANVFSVLANTERWISETLSSASSAPNNPYTRKEVSYVCEQQSESAMIVANIFRKLREAREQGESHGQLEEERRDEVGDEEFSARTLRQTQVVVIPSNPTLVTSFAAFDGLVESVNQARRNARDYVTDLSLEKADGGDADERPWSVSVNCAHLHPKFGEKTREELLKEMQESEENGEVDVNLQAYKEKRMQARRSPYPTIVLEVRSSPPPDFGKVPPPVKETTAADDDVSAEYVQKLEALFGKSAITSKKKSRKQEEDDFYDAIGATFGIDEISTVTPMILAQNWIAQHDDKFDVLTSTFTTSDAKQVDEGYEFVFLNLAMQASKRAQSSTPQSMRQYLVMQSFMSSSATSLSKFSKETANVIKFLMLPGKVRVSTLHPEHVDETRRAPVPVLVFTWE